MDASRVALMEAVLSEGHPPPPSMPVIEDVPYTAAGMMDRARRFVAAPGSDPARAFLEGVYVRDGRAWASNGRAAASFPVVPDVPGGLHLLGAGWSEKGHDYPDLGKVASGCGLSAASALPVSARLLRALAEHSVASAPSRAPNEDGYPCPAVVFLRPPGALMVGSAVLLSEAKGRPGRTPVCAANAPGRPADSGLLYDARLLIPALIGAGAVVGISVAAGSFSPMLVVRQDGELHILMPMRQSVPE